MLKVRNNYREEQLRKRPSNNIMERLEQEKEINLEERFINFINNKYEEVDTLEHGIITTTSIIEFADLHQLPFHRHEINDMLIGMQIKHESIVKRLDKVWYLKQL
jgi:hypothetical protein